MKNKSIPNKMIELKGMLNQVTSAIPSNSNIYYFDYPVHGNVGDLLIWKGTERFFKENQINVMKRYSHHQVIRKMETEEMCNIPKDVSIVCHGGGNFGDLYTEHQRLRKLLVKNYTENRIVVLPQTIHYENKEQMNRDFQLFSQHKDFHLFVRDIKSYNLAKMYIKNVYLCPDMAHSLYPIKSNQNKNNSTLYFIRNDKEKVNSHNLIISEKYYKFDWNLLYSNLDKKLLSTFRMLHSSTKFNKTKFQKLLTLLWLIYTNHIIKKAVILYNKNENIITSRLHGHILACLMNKKNQLLDNSYGKNSSYYECWTTGAEDTYLYEEIIIENVHQPAK